MERGNPQDPPFWALRFLRWFCRREYLEDIEGDLVERFRIRQHQTSATARRQFVLDVIFLCRPGIVRNIFYSDSITTTGMFKNYFITGYRNLLRHKLFSFLNVTGLTLGIASAILILLYVQHEFSYDTFHKNYDRIYRVLHAFRPNGQENDPPPSPSEYQVWGGSMAGPAFKDFFPDVVSYCRLTSPDVFLIQANDRSYQENNIIYSDSTAFTLFSWKLLEGNPARVLTEPNSIVMTRSMARKYFGEGDAVGQTIIVNKTETYAVTGVMEDIPDNSQLNFDGLVSMSTYYANRPEIFDNYGWDYVDFYSYILLDDRSNAGDIREGIPALMKKYRPDSYTLVLSMEPMSAEYLHSAAMRQPGITGNFNNLRLFIFIAIFILFVACVNYMNLSTARSIERAREIGVRKTIGARPSSLVVQFLTESVMITLLSGLLGVLLAMFLLPLMNDLSGKSLDTGRVLTPQNILYFIFGLVVTGLLAGTYPAYILARFRPSRALKGIHKFKSGGINFRRLLVVFQFALSIALIAATAFVFEQLAFLRRHNTGFTKDQILVLDFGWDPAIQQQIVAIKQKFQQIPGVTEVSASRAVPGEFFPNAGSSIEGPDGEMTGIDPGLYEIDDDFARVFDLKMAAGRNFDGDIHSDSSQALLINETMARSLGYSDMSKVVGKKFSQWGRNGQIIGVVKDFNIKSLHDRIEPLALRFAPLGSLTRISMKIRSGDLQATIGKIQAAYNEIDPQRPFLYSFLDESFDQAYKQDDRFGRLFSSFSVISIAIACLGLFGLTIYNANQRRKEIGVRKVMGASVMSIVTMLSKDYVRLFVIAAVLATPVTWMVMHHWLNTFAYQTRLDPVIFALAAVVVLLIVLCTMSIQSYRAAAANPVNSLKDE